LKLYRYTPETREDFIRTLEKISSRLWIPYQAALEYQENRLKVINEQETAYDDIKEKLIIHSNGISKELNNFKYHPFIKKDDLINTINTTFEKIYSELDGCSKHHPNLIKNDIIRERLTELLNGKVGEPCSQEQIDHICKMGKSRYEQKVPPGYKDIDKDKGDKNSIRRYGDLIIWFQIIEKSKKDENNIIFITDDKKEDWWWIFKGDTIGPHHQLIQEFTSKTGASFYMYNADKFLKHCKDYFKQEIRDETIDKVHKMILSDAEKRSQADPTALANLSAAASAVGETASLWGQADPTALANLSAAASAVGKTASLWGQADPTAYSWSPVEGTYVINSAGGPKKISRIIWREMDSDDDRIVKVIMRKILKMIQNDPNLTEEDVNAMVRNISEDYGAARLNISIEFAPDLSKSLFDF